MNSTSHRRRLVSFTFLVWAGALRCQGQGGTGADQTTKRFDQEGCPDIFAQDLFPRYDLQISDGARQALDDDFRNLAAHAAAGLDVNPYHPVVFHFENETIPDAMIRLKGQSSWQNAIAFDPDPKMQFVISFNELNPAGRFHGLRKVELDMPREDYTYLRQRLALSFMRDAGVASQCANNATVWFNGVYYGLYTNLEHMDKEWIGRAFPEAEGGDLWSDLYHRENHETAPDDPYILALRTAPNLGAFAAVVDLDEAVREWATEALMPDGDGFWCGGHNFALYDDPQRHRFVWLPHDLDAAFNFSRFDIDPVYSWRLDGRRPDKRYLRVINDPSGLATFVAALEVARGTYDVEALLARIERWTAQIEASVDKEPHRPFDVPTHIWSAMDLGESIAKRAAFVDRWLECHKNGGDDVDGDGVPWCNDCNDADPSVHPGAAEICGNGVDENCNGFSDEGC